MSLNARDGDDAIDIISIATTRKIVDRRGNTLCDRAICFSFCKSLHELIADVASIEIREHEHIRMTGNGGAWCFRAADLRNDSGIELKLAIESEFGCKFFSNCNRFDDFRSIVVLGRSIRRVGEQCYDRFFTDQRFERRCR